MRTTCSPFPVGQPSFASGQANAGRPRSALTACRTMQTRIVRMLASATTSSHRGAHGASCISPKRKAGNDDNRRAHDGESDDSDRNAESDSHL